MTKPIAPVSKLAWLLLLAAAVGGGCRSAPKADTSAPAATSAGDASTSVARKPVLAPAPAIVFTPDEERMMRAVAGFFAGILGALHEPDMATADESRTVALLAQHLEPIRGPARDLGAKYRALPKERRMAIHEEFFRRWGPQIGDLPQTVASWTARFQAPEEGPKFRRIAEKVLGPWAHDEALWVAAGFGPDAVEELTGWATGREEHEEREERGEREANEAQQQEGRSG